MPAYDGSVKYDGGGKPSQEQTKPVPTVRRKLKFTEIATSPQIDTILNHVEKNFPDGLGQIESMCLINNGIVMAVIPSSDYHPVVISCALAVAFNQMSIRIILNNDQIVRSLKEAIVKAGQVRPIIAPSNTKDLGNVETQGKAQGNETEHVVTKGPEDSTPA
jgi:hypothetical protein